MNTASFRQPAYELVRAPARQPLFSLAHEERTHCRTAFLQELPLHRLHSLRTDRHIPLFLPLAKDPHEPGLPVDHGEIQAADLRGAGTFVLNMNRMSASSPSGYFPHRRDLEDRDSLGT